MLAVSVARGHLSVAQLFVALAMFGLPVLRVAGWLGRVWPSLHPGDVKRWLRALVFIASLVVRIL